jgi:hypothetical protein
MTGYQGSLLAGRVVTHPGTLVPVLVPPPLRAILAAPVVIIALVPPPHTPHLVSRFIEFERNKARMGRPAPPLPGTPPGQRHQWQDTGVRHRARMTADQQSRGQGYRSLDATNMA